MAFSRTLNRELRTRPATACIPLFPTAPLHGYAIAQSIKRISDDVLTVEEGSLYPALQRLLLHGWVKSEWRRTETNRRARFYTLTAAGRRELVLEVSQFRQMVAAIGRVLEDAEESVLACQGNC